MKGLRCQVGVGTQLKLKKAVRPRWIESRSEGEPPSSLGRVPPSQLLFLSQNSACIQGSHELIYQLNEFTSF